MSRVTVRWLHAAVNDLAELWQASSDRPRLETSANELDELLRMHPSQKGTSHALAHLDVHTTELILHRVQALPEDMRSVRFGSVEFFFTSHEDDGMAIVIHVRLRLPRGPS